MKQERASIDLDYEYAIFWAATSLPCAPRHTGSFEDDFAFTQAVGRSFLEIYPKLVRRRMHTPWTQADKQQQYIKRGRYAEFNLIYDRGTRFGLKTDGNVEAILMSLPPMAAWPV